MFPFFFLINRTASTIVLQIERKQIILHTANLVVSSWVEVKS